MTKTLRTVLMSMLVLFVGTVAAQRTVTIDFDENYQTLFPTLPGVSDSNGSSDGDFTELTTSTPVDGVTVTVTASESGTHNRIWTSAPRLRMYNGSFTVTSAAESITKIEFTGHSTNFNLSTTTGTLEGKTWVGEASEIVFAVAKNTQINKMVLTLGGQPGTIDPEPDPEVRSISVAEALNIISALADGAITTDVYQVKGYVVGTPDFQRNNSGQLYGNVNFDMADERGSQTVLTIFRAKSFDGADFTEATILNTLKEGDEVVVEGKLQKYVKNDVVTPEMASGGKLISVNGKTSDDTTPAEVQKVADIRTFATLATNEVAELTLNNALVVYKNVNGSNIELFVRDATGVVDLYNMGIEAEAGQVLNGTIIGSRGANSGFTIAMKKAAGTDAGTVSVGGKQTVTPLELAIDEVSVSYVCQLVKLAGVNVITETSKATFDGAELSLYDRFKTGLLSGLNNEQSYDIYGLVYDGGDTYGIELVVTEITLAGGTPIEEQPATPVPNIASILNLESPSANLELSLSNAQVLFNDNNYIYVRENGKALCFYQMTDELKGLMTTNTILNGSIVVDYEVYRLMPEVKKNANTSAANLSFSEGAEAQPVPTTLADVAAGANVCDLVTLTATKLVETSEGGSNTYYLQSGDVKLVCVNNGKGLNKIEDGTEVTVTGVVNTSNNAYQIKLTKTVDDPAGISDVQRQAYSAQRYYNLQGQRLEKAMKGLNIVDGKKVILK